jgi:hypothetical protein
VPSARDFYELGHARVALSDLAAGPLKWAGDSGVFGFARWRPAVVVSLGDYASPPSR